MSDPEIKESKPSEPRRVSARAKLAAYERERAATAPQRRRLLFLAAVLMIALIALLIFNRKADRTWFDMAKNVSAAIRAGEFEGLGRALARDFRLELPAEGLSLDRNGLLKLFDRAALASRSFFVTNPHRFDSGDTPSSEFFIIWTRGQIERPDVVPLSRCWLVQAYYVHEDDAWRVGRAVARLTLDDGSTTGGAVPGEDGK